MGRGDVSEDLIGHIAALAAQLPHGQLVVLGRPGDDRVGQHGQAPGLYGTPVRGIGVRLVAGRRYPSRQAGDVPTRWRCRTKNRVALLSSNAGISRCAPGLACSVFSVEAKASNNARPDWRSTCSSSHWSRNWSGTVTLPAASVRDSCPSTPKTAAVILGSTAVNGTPIAVPNAKPQ